MGKRIKKSLYDFPVVESCVYVHPFLSFIPGHTLIMNAGCLCFYSCPVITVIPGMVAIFIVAYHTPFKHDFQIGQV